MAERETKKAKKRLYGGAVGIRATGKVERGRWRYIVMFSRPGLFCCFVSETGWTRHGSSNRKPIAGTLQRRPDAVKGRAKAGGAVAERTGGRLDNIPP